MTSQFIRPPINLLYCEAGHGWWRLNPVYVEGEQRAHGHTLPKACPTHTYALRGQTISEAMRRSHLRREAELPGGTIPPVKRCTGPCGQIKPSREFGVRFEQTKAFGERVRLRPMCLACESEKTKAYRERQQTEDPERYAKRRRATSRRNNRRRRGPEKRVSVDAAPLVKFWHTLNGTKPELDPTMQRALERLLSGEQATIRIEIVDQLLLAAGRQDMLSVLYGRH